MSLWRHGKRFGNNCRVVGEHGPFWGVPGDGARVRRMISKADADIRRAHGRPGHEPRCGQTWPVANSGTGGLINPDGRPAAAGPRYRPDETISKSESETIVQTRSGANGIPCSNSCGEWIPKTRGERSASEGCSATV